MTLDWVCVMTVLRVMTRVGVGAVTVARGPNSCPETTVTGGGVIVAVVGIVTAIVAVEVTSTVFVTLSSISIGCPSNVARENFGVDSRGIQHSIRGVDGDDRLVGCPFDPRSLCHALTPLTKETFLVNLHIPAVDTPCPEAARNPC